MSPTTRNVCERCLLPIDPSTGCRTHPLASRLDLDKPDDQAWFEALEQLRSQRRARAGYLAFWVVLYVVLVAVSATIDGWELFEVLMGPAFFLAIIATPSSLVLDAIHSRRNPVTLDVGPATVENEPDPLGSTEEAGELARRAQSRRAGLEQDR